MTHSTTSPTEPQFKTTKAPSEKHLEDWIVANPTLFADYNEDFDDYLGHEFVQSIVARQVILPAGRLDLLAIRDGSNGSPLTLAVVELKKGAITYDVLAQCLKYIHDMREIYYWSFMDFIAGIGVPFDINIMSVEQYPFTIFEPITGVLVGHSVPDPDMVTIAAAAHVALVTYEYFADEDYYAFHECYPSSRGTIQQYKGYVPGVVGDATRSIIRQCAKRYPRKDSVQS